MISRFKKKFFAEAYKAIEDIHGLMILSKKVFQPKMMANYYQKLALVFWKCGNQLFHAAAIFKYFQLTREMKKNISPEELGELVICYFKKNVTVWANKFKEVQAKKLVK